MQHHASLRRSLFLALSLLSACAAGNAGSGSAGSGTAGVADARTGGPAPGALREQPFDVGLAGEYLDARFATSQFDLNYAADSYLRILAADPGNQEVAQQAMVTCLLIGRPEAVTLARSHLTTPAAQLLVATEDARNGNWESAEQRFTRLPRQGLTQILEPLLVAWSQQGQGRTDAALATLRPFAESAQTFRGAYALHAALIADLAGRTEQAARLYGAAQTDRNGMGLQLGRLLASWQARQGHVDEARHTLRDLLASAPDLAVAAPGLEADIANVQIRRPADGLADAYLALAAALREQDASDFAMVLLRLALNLRPDLTSARLLFADVLETAKHYDAALAMLAPVGPGDPLYAVVRLRRASLQNELGDSDQALRTLDAAAAEMPARPDSLAMAGDILRAKHRFADAVVAYDRAIARVPNPTRSNWPLFYERGIALERSHQWPRAEADFRKALELSPDEPFVLNYLGYTWTEQGHNLAEARQMIERAVEQRPNDGAIIDSLGWVLLRQGEVTAAIKQLEKASELEPEDSTINGHLGDAYWAAGRKLDAAYQWRLAVAFGPEPEDRPRLDAKLRESEQALGMPAVAVQPATAEKATP